jgi:outer membrane protein TolC
MVFAGIISAAIRKLLPAVVVTLVACGAFAGSASSGSRSSSNFITAPLSLPEAVNIALKQNAAIRRARQDIEATQGIALQTRAVAIPRVELTGFFTAAQPSDVDIIVNTNFSFGNDKNWQTQLRVVQSIYEGGRVKSALRTARLSREQAVLSYQTTVQNIVLDAETAYFDVLLQHQQVDVEEASVELLTRELSDTQKRYNAGTLPSFNVLRAEVELANEKPRLVRARSSERIAKNNLANLLGFDIPGGSPDDIPLNLSGRLEAEPYQIDLSQAISTALQKRTELASLRRAEELRKEDVISATAGFKPRLEAYGGYDFHNSLLSQDLTEDRHGLIAGVQLTWDIFDGYRTKGRVIEARARRESASIEVEDTTRRIELEVRTGYSAFREAEEVVASEQKVVEQGEEALRLARSRAEAGTATQLDVLSAQTALTQARTTQAQALHDYAVARARLERATGALLVEEARVGK